MIDGREVENPTQASDAASMDRCDADIIDQLFGDQLLAIPYGVEHLADRNGRCGMLADKTKALLQLCRHRVFKPE